MKRQWIEEQLGHNEEYVIRSGLLRVVAISCGGTLAWISFKLSYAFGETMSQEGAYACAAISVLSSFMVAIWLGAGETLRELGAGRLISAFSAIALGLVCWDGFTNSMTSAFQRQADITKAVVTKAAAEGVGDSLAELEATEKRLLDRQQRLDGEMDKLVNIKVGDWAVAVRPSSPDELDAQIKAKRLERDNEAARGGCKSQCERRQNELAHLEALRAKAAEIAKNNAEHQRVLEALASVRNKKADAQAVAADNLSGAQFQALKAASWAAAATGDFSRKPGEGLVSWIEDVMGSMQGLMVMLGAQAFLGMGLLTRSQVMSLHRGEGKPRAPPVGESGNRNVSAPPSETANFARTPFLSEPIVVHTVEKDESLRRWALSDEVRALLGGQAQLKAV